MLVPIIFIIAFMFALCGALLESSFLAAKTATQTSLVRYGNAALHDGIAGFTQGLASFIARHGSGGPWPLQTSRSEPRSMCEAPDEQAARGQCLYRYTVAATLTNGSNAAGRTAGVAALDLQAAVIDEQRVSAVVSITLLSPDARVVATRSRFLTYRVFATAPFAIIESSRDGSAPDGTQPDAQSATGGEPYASNSATFNDTRIHVRLTCAATGGNDALPWGNAPQAAYEAPCTSTDAPADAFRDEHWRDGNLNATGWTR